jgi:hypothetical protein
MRRTTSPRIAACGAARRRAADTKPQQTDHREGQVGHDVPEVRNPVQPALIGEIVVPRRLSQGGSREDPREHRQSEAQQHACAPPTVTAFCHEDRFRIGTRHFRRWHNPESSGRGSAPISRQGVKRHGHSRQQRQRNRAPRAGGRATCLSHPQHRARYFSVSAGSGRSRPRCRKRGAPARLFTATAVRSASRTPAGGAARPPAGPFGRRRHAHVVTEGTQRAVRVSGRCLYARRLAGEPGASGLSSSARRVTSAASSQCCRRSAGRSRLRMRPPTSISRRFGVSKRHRWSPWSQ